jgi:hypothetical protein
MFKAFHNKLGENGQSSTVLSLLKDPQRVGSDGPISGSLSEVSARLVDIAGGDDVEVVSMYSVYPTEGGSLEFLAVELLPLRQAKQRISQINGGRGDAEVELNVLDRPDELEGSVGPVSQAITHLRGEVRNLFNRTGEDGRPLTVPSLLSQPARHPSPPE